MARISCPECKRQISETAEACPKCGYKLTPEEASEIKKKEKDTQKAVAIGCLVVFLLPVFIVMCSKLLETPRKSSTEDIRREGRQQMRGRQQQWEGIWIIETLDYKPPDTVMSDALVDFISWHWHFYSSGRFKSILASKTKSDERTILATTIGTYDLGDTTYTIQPTHLNSVAVNIISAEQGKWFAVGDELVLTPHGDGHVKKLRRKTEISTPLKSQAPPARQQRLSQKTPGDNKAAAGTEHYKNKYREAHKANETAKSNYNQNPSISNKRAWDDATNKLDRAYLQLEKAMGAEPHKGVTKQRLELEAFTERVERDQK